ncbi:hypothetical protein NI17_017220 [Thermobifida halotolerans]|uniref:Uncharacterized protein n=1 Tax=Thermobifida halotolerans TaxID=483545 RepID=A0A399G3S9_9ACTN|nr:hypothetical protein [Thermobifida halotolerans]UOE18546.1 hypothetical protein NI17_017220 [Thermobifida halotolerans]
MPAPLLLAGIAGRAALSVGARMLVRQGVKAGVRQGVRQGIRGSLRQSGKDFASDLASDAVSSLLPNPLDPTGIVGIIAEEKLGYNPLDPMSTAGHFAEKKLGFDPFDPVEAGGRVIDEVFGNSSEESEERAQSPGGRDSDDRRGTDPGDLFGDLAAMGGIGVVAGLLLAAIKSLAAAGDGRDEGRSDDRNNARGDSPGGGVVMAGFTPIASAYSGDDKAPQLQQGVLLGT